jgi:hypothetical protein
MSELTDDASTRTRETLGPRPYFHRGYGARCGNSPNSARSLRVQITMAMWHRDNMIVRRFSPARREPEANSGGSNENNFVIVESRL